MESTKSPVARVQIKLVYKEIRNLLVPTFGNKTTVAGERKVSIPGGGGGGGRGGSRGNFCGGGAGGGGLRRVILGIFGGGVPLGSPNPDPVSAQKSNFPHLFSNQNSKIHTRF